MPAESVNYVKRGNHNEIDDNDEDNDDEIAGNATKQAEEIREMKNDNDDHDMSAESAASQAVRGSVKQGEGESDNYAPKRLPNELLDKIITFALTGTELSVIEIFSSLCQLGDRIQCLASRYICHLPRVSYSHRDIPSKSFHSMPKLCEEFCPCSELVLALKR